MKRRSLLFILSFILILSLACSLNLPGAPTATPPAPSPTPTALPLPPAIIETVPPPGSQIGLQSPLAIYFSEPMERASVEAAFRSPNASQFLFQWLDDATLQITPAQPFLADDRIEITLGVGAKTAKGLALPREVTLSYRTPGLLTVSQVLPAPQAQSVTPDSAVVVAFNQPVVPLGADSASLPAGFTLEPAASGRGEWLNTSTYIFYPDPSLSGGVDYTVRVNPSLKSTAGTPLDPSTPNLAWSFQTALPEVLEISPQSGDFIGIDARIDVTFNQPMDAASVEAAFALRGPEGSKVPGTFSWNERGTVVTFTASGGPLPRQTAYALTIGAEARSRGGAPLGQDVQAQFSTYPPFQFEGANIPEGGTRSYPEGLFLSFSAPLTIPKGADLSELLILSPRSESFGAVVDGNTINIYGGFEAGQTYTLTLPASLSDQWGQTLGQDVQFTFREPDAQPSLEYGSWMEELFTRPAEPVLSVRAVNVQTILISRGTLTLDEFLRLDSDYNFRQNFVPPDNETWTLRPNLPRNLNKPVEFRLSEGPLTPGLYMVQIDSPDISYRTRNMRLLVSSDVNVTVKASVTEVLAWAVDLRSGQPVSFATARVYDEKGAQIASGQTDANGLWRGEITSGASARMVVIGKPGEEQFGIGSPDWNLGVSPFDFGLRFEPGGPRPVAYLYTDRPIYRPGDVVSFRGVLRSQYDGRYSLVNTKKLGLRLSNPNGVDEEQTVGLSELGTFNGQFRLSEKAVPGWYYISIDMGGDQWLEGGSIALQVADYRKPEINLSVQLQPNPAQSGQALTGVVRAGYFFGAPAADLPFQWTLYSRQDYFSIPSFSTGIYEGGWFSLGRRFGDVSQSGEGRTDANGRFVIPLENIEVNDTTELTLEITATESGGFPVSARATLTVHPDSFYIGVRPQVWFGQAGSPMNFDLLTVDWEQNPVSRAVQAGFKKVRWEREELTDGYKLNPVFTPLESKSVSTGADGRGEVSFTPSEAGTYALEVTSGQAKTQLLLWVGGAQNAAWPDLPYNYLHLTSDQTEYKPGQTAEVFIPNPFNEPVQALLTTERGALKTAQVVSIPAEGYRLRLPITEEEAPNIYVSATLLGSGEDFRQGYINLPVDPAAFILNVTLKATPEKAKPGDTLTLDLTVTDQKGQPVQGVFSLAVVDLATLALAEPNSEDIIPAYYKIQPLGVRTGLTDAISTRRLLDMGGGLGGGGGEDILTIREDFPDTAYWNANITTNLQGKAQITLTLPDNLTTWQVESRGLTKDTKVGQARVRVVTTKDLLIRPQTPRFLVVGDVAELAAIVNNNTAQEQQAVISLKAEGFRLEAGVQAEQTVTIPANGRARVAWRGTVSDVEALDVVFSVKSAQFQDAARPNEGKIPVLRYTAPQTFSTAGILTDSNAALTEILAVPRTFRPLGGELTLELSPSLASAILSALEAHTLPDQPWSTEQILSYLLPNTVTYLTLQSVSIENPALRVRLERDLRDGTGRLLAAQMEDGGWGWALTAERSDPFLTAYMVYGLEKVRQSGLAGDDETLLTAIQRGRDYLFSTAEPFTGAADLTDPFWANRAAFYCFVLQETGSLNNFGYVADELYGERERLDPWAKAMLATTLSRSNPADERIRTLVSDLEATAIRSATGVHWESKQGGWLTPGSPLYTTAIVVYTLTERDPASPLAADAARYLAAQRGPKGWSASEYENAWMVLALDRFMAATGEFRADFGYSAALNGVNIAEGQAAGPQNLTTVTTITPLSQMMLNGANQLTISRQAGVGRLYYRALLSVLRPVETAPAINQGIAVSREYLQCNGEKCQPVTSYQMREDESGRLTARVTVTIPNDAYYFLLEDFIPAGADILDPSLKTSQQGEESQSVEIQYDENDPFGAGWGWWYFNRPQVYRERILWSADYLPAGTYVLTYTIIPSLPGEYRVLPAHAWLAYFPEVQGTTAGAVFKILK